MASRNHCDRSCPSGKMKTIGHKVYKAGAAAAAASYGHDVPTQNALNRHIPFTMKLLIIILQWGFLVHSTIYYMSGSCPHVFTVYRPHINCYKGRQFINITPWNIHILSLLGGKKFIE